EDGIRDRTVTGVQTCALPIWLRQAFAKARGVRAEIPPDIRVAMWSKFLFIAALSGVGSVTRAPIGVIRGQPESRRMLRQALEERSEERRVGKECRAW